MVKHSLKLWIGIVVIVVVVFSGLVIRHSLRKDPMSIERSEKSLSHKSNVTGFNEDTAKDSDVENENGNESEIALDGDESAPYEYGDIIVTQSTQRINNRRNTDANASGASTAELIAERKQKAQDELDAAKEKYEQAEQKLNQCNTALDEAKARRDQLQNEYDSAKAKLDEANRNYDESQKENYNKGMLGFFESVGDQTGVDTLVGSDLISLVNFADPADAASLECMKKSVDYLKFVNQVRVAEGMPEIRVSCKLMALAALNNDLYAADSNNSNGTGLDEDLAIGFDDPFTIWYYDEKDSQGGNYLSLINEAHKGAGFGFSHKKGNVHNVLFCDEGYDAGNLVSVKDFANKFNSYYSSAIKGKSTEAAEDQFNRVSSALEAAKQNVSDRVASAQAASTAFGSAKAIYEQKLNAVKAFEK